MCVCVWRFISLIFFTIQNKNFKMQTYNVSRKQASTECHLLFLFLTFGPSAPGVFITTCPTRHVPKSTLLSVFILYWSCTSLKSHLNWNSLITARLAASPCSPSRWTSLRCLLKGPSSPSWLVVFFFSIDSVALATVHRNLYSKRLHHFNWSKWKESPVSALHTTGSTTWL